jgi:hypothetical protein
MPRRIRLDLLLDDDEIDLLSNGNDITSREIERCLVDLMMDGFSRRRSQHQKQDREIFLKKRLMSKRRLEKRKQVIRRSQLYG